MAGCSRKCLQEGDGRPAYGEKKRWIDEGHSRIHESACAICFFLPTKVVQKATPYWPRQLEGSQPSLSPSVILSATAKCIMAKRGEKKSAEKRQNIRLGRQSSSERREMISQSGWVVLIQNGGSLLNIYTVIIPSQICRCRIATDLSWEQDSKEEL